MSAIDPDDAWENERAAQHDAERHAPIEPRPGSRADAIERGYDPRDWMED